ncbi:MAG: recombinase family protein, partial [Firmicutes bacterium]|nr:recombinase family protein [Bacillota bacterium]
MHSLSAQISYYNSLIQKNPDWEYVGVYADDFISGTKTVKRTEFNRMLEDCEKCKIDIILTKSISRFARNTVDLLETVRHLKSKGIEVRFEKENINSMSGDGELMLSILASFAQEESRSISENVKWGTRKRFKKGIPNGKFHIYGYRWEGEELVIEPEEAEIVKRIFQNFLDGKSRLETEREFAAEGITTRNGCRWVDSNIKSVLTNITYTGNMLFQKEFITDPISKQRKKNRGELPQYYVEDTHEAIIDKETFDYVQKEIARRKELGPLANKSLNVTCFTGKIKCDHCGVSFMHNTHKNKAKLSVRGDRLISWVCGTKKKKGGRCPTREIPDHTLKQICAEVLGTSEFDEDTFTEQVEKITVPEHGTLVFWFKDGSTVTRHWSNTSHKDCWTAEYRAFASEQRRKTPRCKNASELTAKIRCSACGCNFRRATRRSSASKTVKLHYWRCSGHGENCRAIGLKEETLKEFISKVMGTESYNADAFKKQVEAIYIKGKSTFEFHFADGTIKTEEYIPPARKMPPRSEEFKARMRETMKAKWTPEKKKEMSERMKALRKERGRSWRKGK